MKHLMSIIAVQALLLATSFFSFGQNQPVNTTNERFVYEDGSLYYGEMKDGVPAGAGTVFYADGDQYRGGWKDHAPYGKGTMYWVGRKKKLTAIWEAAKPVQVLSAGDTGRNDPALATVEEQAVKVWAVIVGVGRYSHLPALKYADDDAYLFFSFLKSPQGGALPREQITILIDEEATRTNILAAMQATFGAAGENDMVLFYFSGHGVPEALLPVDFNGYDNPLLHQEIRELFGSCKAKHKLLLADACNAGGMLTTKSPGSTASDEFYAGLQKNTGDIAFLLSSKDDELSLEDDELRSGVFSHFLLNGLHGEADIDGNGLITISELYYYVDQRVHRYTNYVQTPILIGNFDRNMPVATVRPAMLIRSVGF